MYVKIKNSAQVYGSNQIRVTLAFKFSEIVLFDFSTQLSIKLLIQWDKYQLLLLVMSL